MKTCFTWQEINVILQGVRADYAPSFTHLDTPHVLLELPGNPPSWHLTAEGLATHPTREDACMMAACAFGMHLGALLFKAPKGRPQAWSQCSTEQTDAIKFYMMGKRVPKGIVNRMVQAGLFKTENSGYGYHLTDVGMGICAEITNSIDPFGKRSEQQEA